MEKVIRYAVKMKNGGYMRQEFSETHPGIVDVLTVDHILDAGLLKNKKVAESCVHDVLSGNTNLMCIFDDDNPPESVVEVELAFAVASN